MVVDEREFAKRSTAKLKPKYDSTDLKADVVFPGGSNDNIFWFMQITDLHLSKFFDRGRTKALLDFCVHTVPLIRPDFVVASGDLTDAKAFDQQESVQQEEEWQAYKKAIDDSGILSHTPWFDVRGNHDAFNVPNIEHRLNYFKDYSVQGKAHRRSYSYHHRKSFGVYSFIFMDASPSPGPKRPYNFYGFLDQNNTAMLREFSRDSSASNMSVWIGHHTTSTVISIHENLNELIGCTAVAYVCGHLHTLGGNVPQMYTLQPQGFLELELGDWRDSRYYRVMAIDHDIFSFIDVHLHQWPVILITNPKDAKFIVPSKEMSHRIARSTHIRILAWSVAPISEVNVFIDGKYIGNGNRVNKDAPLYVLPWNTELLNDGKRHQITVYVEDEIGNAGNVSHYFKTDGSPIWDFEYTPSYILLRHQGHSVRMVYLFLWFSLVAFLLLFRVLKYRLRWIQCYFDHPFTLAAYRFSQHDKLFFPLMAYLVYTFLGPLIFGPLIDGHWGCVYLSGVQISGTFIPESLPYLTEIFQLLTFVGPMFVYLLHCIHQSAINHENIACSNFCCRRIGYLLLNGWQFIYTVVSLTLPYGIVTTLLSPCRLYLIPLSFYLLYHAESCPRLVFTAPLHTETNETTLNSSNIECSVN